MGHTNPLFFNFVRGMQFDILTIFPKIFNSYFNESILKRAQKKRKIKIKIHNIRDNAMNNYGQVDDRPYGGGPGMLLMFEPIYKTLKNIKHKKNSKIILFSAKGKTINQQKISSYAKLDQLIMVCGHYEGIDERIIEFIDEEISIGDYVLTGGEIPAMLITDAVTRLIPGVLGKDISSEDESHTKKDILEYPQYTRPETIKVKGKKLVVPKILTSGHHKNIKTWREKKKKK